MSRRDRHSDRPPAGDLRVPRPIAALTAVLPRSFRDRHAAALLATMSDLHGARSRGRGAAIRAIHWLILALDVIATSVALRLGDRDPQRADHAETEPVTGRSSSFMTLAQDLRFATRALIRRPAFSALVVVTLALGLGANAAVYGLVDALLIDPIPVHRPQEVVAVFEALTENAHYEGTAYPNYRDYREGTRSLRGLAAFGELNAGFVTGNVTERIPVGVVTGNYFTVLGLRPVAGRLLAPSDESAPGATPYIVLSHGLWRRLFGADTSAIGRSVRVNGAPFTIVGVAPRGFRGTLLSASPEAWVPITMVRSIGAGGLFSAPNVLETRAFQWLRMVGRLRPGATAASVEAELNAIVRRIRAEDPGLAAAFTVESPVRARPVAEGATIASREELLRFVALLGGVAMLTLLIACLNVASLMLARGVERMRELGVRAALGAGRWRLVRQLLLESLLLGLGGGAAGVIVALATFAMLRSFTLPGGIELASLPLEVNPALLAFSAIASMATVVGFGLLPALRATRGNLAHRVASTGARASVAAGRPRAMLLAAQVALSFVLLTGAALLLRSLATALRTDLGFEPRRVAALSFGLRQHGYDVPRGVQFYRTLLETAAARADVASAALAVHVPIGGSGPYLPITVEGAAPDHRNQRAAMNPIMGDYFQTLRIPLVAGRALGAGDHDPAAPKVAVANETAVQRFWPGENPLGKQLRIFGRDRITVVGVVRDSRYGAVREDPRPFLFVSAAQFPTLMALDRISVLARGPGEARATLASLEQTVRSLEPTLPIFDARVVSDQIDRVLMPQHFGLRLLGAFGVLALLISAVGIYGLVTYTVVQRTHEIGIRMALGAPLGNVLAVVTRQTVLAAGAGVVLGIGVALAVSRFLASFLYGVTTRDPASFALAASLLLTAAVVATVVPARRAARIDPIQAIRD